MKYENHTKIGVSRVYTVHTDFGMNNIPMSMYYIPSYKYVFHSYLRMLSIPFKYVLHTIKVCIT